MLNLRQELLKTCFERFEGEFSAGDRANNIMNIRRVAETTHLKNYIIRLVGSLAVVESVDFITAVPEGANWIAEEVANAYDLPFARLIKWPDTKEIEFRSQEDYEIAEKGSRGLLAEDAATTLFNVRKCLAIPPLDEKIVVVSSIFDRGNRASRTPLPVEYRALAHQYIPPMLREDSELWAYADER